MTPPVIGFVIGLVIGFVIGFANTMRLHNALQAKHYI